MRNRQSGKEKGKGDARSGKALHSSRSAAAPPSLWFSANPVKRSGEAFFLKWSVVWMSIMAVIVATRVFEHFTAWTYMFVGIIVGGPCVVYPIVFPLEGEKHLPLFQRYTTKANIWIWILTFIGNYFWTHYFYQVLGAKYTFDAHRLNDVPFCLFLITQSYFASYHVFSNLVLRRLWHAFSWKPSAGAYITVTLVICLMSYVVAFMETFTIQNFPYYELADRHAMYVYGSMFYAIYFLGSFPMFLRLDEQPGECWGLGQTIIESMGTCMMVTLGLDFWRLFIGPITEHTHSSSVPFVN